MEWQPISTVPAGTPILITDGEIVTVTVLGPCGKTEKWMFGHGFGGYEWEFDFQTDQATHWMPLPEPPK